jgi:hypothetical protein
VAIANALATATPRIAVTADGSHAVIIHRGVGATAIRLEDRATICELPLLGDADVAWLGTSHRLLIVAPVETHTDVKLVNPADGSRLAEIRVETEMRLAAANGTHALLLGARTAAMLSGGEASVTPYQFLARTLPTVVGVAGAQFVVALPGTIEEWDPASRMPKRRLRLPKAAPILSLGGSDRVLWMTTQADPMRLDVLPLVNRGQPKGHDLPEAIRAVHGHPHTDAVICLGAESGRIYAIDLDGKHRLRTIAVPGIDQPEAIALVVGRGGLSVIAVQAGRIATAPIEAREVEPVAQTLPPIPKSQPVTIEPALPPRRSELYDPTPEPTRAARSAPTPERSLSDPAPRAEHVFVPAVAVEDPSPRTERPSRTIVEPEPVKQVAPTAWSEGAADLMAKLAALRAAGHEPGSPEAPLRSSWRDDAGMWARAVASGTFDRAAPSCPPIEVLANRFELPPALLPALVLIYGSHLAGLEGAAPMDVARVLGRRWDDALGRGALAKLGLAIYERSRVMLAPVVQRALDELPPGTGELVGDPGPVPLLGPMVVVGMELAELAARCSKQLGCSVLIARQDVELASLLLEARALGAAPMKKLSLRATKADHAIPQHPILVVVSSDDHADQLGLPRLELGR